MEQATLSIDGMNCNHCVRAVTQALQNLPGVTVRDVTLGSATVAYDPSVTSLDEMIDAVNDEGYAAARAAGSTA